MRPKKFVDRKEYMREYMRSRRGDPKIETTHNLSFRELERAKDAERKRLARSDIMKLEEYRAKDAARKRLVRSGQAAIKKEIKSTTPKKTPPKLKKVKVENKEQPTSFKTAASKKYMKEDNHPELKEGIEEAKPEPSKKPVVKKITKVTKDDQSPKKDKTIKLKIRLPITTKNRKKANKKLTK